MKIKTKLYLGFIAIICLLMFFGTSVLYIFNQQRDNISEVVTENYERVRLANEIKYITEATATNIREVLLAAPGEVSEDQIQLIRDYRREATVAIDALQYTAKEDTLILVSSIRLLNSEYDSRIEFILDQSHGLTFSGLNEFSPQEREVVELNNEIRQALITEIDAFTLAEEESMDLALLESEQTYQNAISIFTTLAVISILFVIGISLSVTRSINRSINKVRSVMTTIGDHTTGKLPRIDVRRKDEIGDIAKAYNHMAASLEQITEKEKQLNDSLISDNWIKTEYAKIADSLQGVQELKRFEELFLENIAPTVKAVFGVFYLKEEGNILRKQASYATEDEVIGEETIKLGQGLVGQCAANNKVMHLENLPSDYIATTSGLGKAQPTSLILLPIEFDRGVIGVLELAKFEPFTPLQVELLEQISQSIGVSINQILNHIKISDLLAESQMTTEELQSQSEELQQQQEELKSINEKLHEQYKKSDEKTKELEQIKLDLEEKNRNIELSSKYKSEFLANMSHELRTPLNSILILSQLLHENEKGNLTKDQVEHAETIYTSGKDLLELINDILDLSKIESGKIDVYAEEVEIKDVKAFVKRQFSPIAKQKGLDFNISIHPGTPRSVLTDDQRLKQILKNLLSNAFKFTTVGSVEFFVKREEMGSDSNLVFSVKDTGIGISNEKQLAIFEAFYQGDGTTTRKYGGTGLGLSISRELAQLLGGSIEVQSKEGEGSTFTLYLPNSCENTDDLFIDFGKAAVTNESEITNEESLSREEPEQEKAQQVDFEKIKSNKPLENKRVLIVDDDMRNVFALTTVLENHQMKVLFAENGKEAIEMLEEYQDIDIVLMDIMMPIMDGYEAMKEIRKKECFKELPIIALTAKAMKHDKAKCIEAGASDYISKPVDKEQLLSLMKVWVYQLEGV